MIAARMTVRETRRAWIVMILLMFIWTKRGDAADLLGGLQFLSRRHLPGNLQTGFGVAFTVSVGCGVFHSVPSGSNHFNMKIADWYFDFISPYAYLQANRLQSLSDRVEIRAKPVLFAGLLNHHGQLGPAEIEPKRQFVFRQALWLAKREGIVMKLPPEHPFNPLPPLRLALAMNSEIDAIRTIFDFIWRDGRNTGDAQEWKSLTNTIGLSDADEKLADPAIKNALRSNTDEAIARGVFGVPTLIVDDELFWGHDAADFLLEYLHQPDALRRDIFEPVNKLAQGTARRKRPE